MKNPIIVIFTLIMLSGCTISYKAVGKYIYNSDKFAGNVEANIWTGGGSVTLQSKSTGSNCSGKAVLTKSGFSCTGQEGIVSLKCNDGRELNGIWRATSCTTG